MASVAVSHLTSSLRPVAPLLQSETTPVGPHCPFAQLQLQPKEIYNTPGVCPFHQKIHANPPTPTITEEVEVAGYGRTHQTSEDQARLLQDIGGGDRLRELCTRFYSLAFQDYTLDKFMFEKDGAAAHGKRLADWIIQKMGGEGTPWSDSGRWGQRQPSHAKAWNCVKRDPAVRGEHFQLDDCRIWMRLMFWAARDCGLDQHQSFFKWYVGFISHFIAVYERSAPPYAAKDTLWSANPKNIQKYLQQGRKMDDVIGQGRHY